MGRKRKDDPTRMIRSEEVKFGKVTMTVGFDDTNHTWWVRSECNKLLVLNHHSRASSIKIARANFKDKIFIDESLINKPKKPKNEQGRIAKKNPTVRKLRRSPSRNEGGDGVQNSVPRKRRNTKA